MGVFADGIGSLLDELFSKKILPLYITLSIVATAVFFMIFMMIRTYDKVEENEKIISYYKWIIQDHEERLDKIERVSVSVKKGSCDRECLNDVRFILKELEYIDTTRVKNGERVRFKDISHPRFEKYYTYIKKDK
jgi:ABC-type anion transport system duplicated permease subunit